MTEASVEGSAQGNLLEPGMEYEAVVQVDIFALDIFWSPPAAGQEAVIKLRCAEKLGAGGQGQVYRALVLRADGSTFPVALKIAAREAIGNVWAEAQVLRAADWKGIGRFFALVQLNIDGVGSQALLTEYQHGRTLAAILATTRGNKIHAAEVLALGERILNTLSNLAAAEGQRGALVHGDIKPGNIIVPDEGGTPNYKAAVLIDFGMGHHLTELGARRSVRGDTQGFRPFSPGDEAFPEQDVFATAVTLYQALTGRLPLAPSRTAPLDPAPFTLSDLPPWVPKWAWRQFFRMVLRDSNPAEIPGAANALDALRKTQRNHRWQVMLLLFLGAFLLAALALTSARLYDTYAYCEPGKVRCQGTERAILGGECRDLKTHRDNCGACGARAPDDQVCKDGHFACLERRSA